MITDLFRIYHDVCFCLWLPVMQKSLFHEDVIWLFDHCMLLYLQEVY